MSKPFASAHYQLAVPIHNYWDITVLLGKSLRPSRLDSTIHYSRSRGTSTRRRLCYIGLQSMLVKNNGERKLP